MTKYSKHKVIQSLSQLVKEKFENETTGHDWWHTLRVFRMARRIGRKEKVNLFIIELASLLHDIADWKFHKGDDGIGAKVARDILVKYNIPESDIAHVCEIVKNVSFKGAGVKSKIKTREGMVVQDADRLDALGAIGVARTFAYGGHVSLPIYNPEGKIRKHKNFEEYKKGSDSSIHHFYDKLLLLKGRMNTRTGKHIAQERHKFIEDFLNRFFQEWDGEK